ncbi:MAG: nucleotidyltransferase domain-containing protein [Chloroflexota bacterium]
MLGGSQARGEAHADSDLDLGIYYHPEHPPSVAALREIAARVDDRHSGDAVTEFGGWGPYPAALKRAIVDRFLRGIRLCTRNRPVLGRSRRCLLCVRVPVPRGLLPGAGALRPQRALSHQ